MHAVDKSMFKSLQWGDSISHAHYSKQYCRHNLGFDVSQVLSILRLWKECLLLNSYDHHVWVCTSKSWNGFLNTSMTKSWHILITANSTVPFRRNKLFSLPVSFKAPMTQGLRLQTGFQVLWERHPQPFQGAFQLFGAQLYTVYSIFPSEFLQDWLLSQAFFVYYPSSWRVWAE